jgi:ketosteroid isomerase-like protein
MTSPMQQPTTSGRTDDLEGLDALRQGVERTNRRFEEAFDAGDVEGAVRDVYTSQGRILPPDASPVQGREGIARFWQGAREMGVTRCELETLELHPMGDGAYELGRGRLTLATGAQVTAKYVVIWQHEEGRWRWHVDIWNMEPGA